MKVLIISASHRKNSQSRKVADYITDLIRQEQYFTQTNLIDLARTKIPLWDEGVWKGNPGWEEILRPIKSKVEQADAYIIIVPEWNGSVPPSIKNFALFFGEKQTGHKPVWIVSVTSEINGSYPVSEMRSFVYKNNKWVFIPDHTIIRFVNDVLNKKEPQTENEKLLVERMHHSLNQLKLYAEALEKVRKNLNWDNRFKYAM